MPAISQSSTCTLYDTSRGRNDGGICLVLQKTAHVDRTPRRTQISQCLLVSPAHRTVSLPSHAHAWLKSQMDSRLEQTALKSSACPVKESSPSPYLVFPWCPAHCIIVLFHITFVVSDHTAYDWNQEFTERDSAVGLGQMQDSGWALECGLSFWRTGRYILRVPSERSLRATMVPCRGGQQGMYEVKKKIIHLWKVSGNGSCRPM